MTAFWMRELAPPEVPGFANRDQLLCRNASTHDRASRVGYDSASPQRHRVLVVDDEQESAESLIGMVRRWGHAAHVAFDGIAAVRVAAARHPDVVLLDMDMPLLDGCHVARQLRLDFPSKECFIIAFAEPIKLKRNAQGRPVLSDGQSIGSALGLIATRPLHVGQPIHDVLYPENGQICPHQLLFKLVGAVGTSDCFLGRRKTLPRIGVYQPLAKAD